MTSQPSNHSAQAQNSPNQAGSPTSQGQPFSNLAGLFAAKPPRYPIPVPRANQTPTKDTRIPKFFDLHLAEPLQLKKLVLSDDLPEILSTVCDHRMHALSRPLHTVGFDEDFQNKIKDALQCPTKPMHTEDDIAKHYSTRTSLPSLRAASRIAFSSKLADSPTGWSPMFIWETTSTTKEVGLCDGYVTVGREGPLFDSLSKKFRDKINSLQTYLLLKFALVEFKSLAAGDLETMEAILDITSGDGEFTWMTCGTWHFNRLQECNVEKHANRSFQISLTGRKTGPDSNLSWWDNSKPGKRKASGNSSSEAPPARRKRPAKGRPDLSEAAFAAMKKAHYIIQQVWAELVHEDATFAVISSGNYEIYVRRHRETQTLYVSNVVRPDSNGNPRHYKLHTSLYVAGWLDAVNRATQLERMLKSSLSKEASEDIPGWVTSYLTDCYDEDSNTYPSNALPGSKSKPTLQEKRQAMNNEAAKVETVLVHLENANIIKIRLPKSVWRGEDLFVFTRTAVKYAAQSNPHNKMNLEAIAINAKPFASTKVWRATLGMLPGPGERTFSSSELIVMKLAKTIPARQALKEEYIRHKQFFAWSPQSFLRAYGLFQCPMPGGDIVWDVLILQYGGKTLEDLMGNKPSEAARVKYRDAILSTTLKPLHEHGVLHQSLTADHVLFLKKGVKLVFYPIGFKECEFLWTTKDGEREKKKDEEFMETFEARKRRDAENVRLALQL